MAGKPKQFTRPPKKQKSKAANQLETADDFQEAADAEEETGGKWRAGDPAKSGRAFVRALDVYDRGLQRYPNNFDLAYNKARLMLEVTQQPALVQHIGLPVVDLLKQTLDAHRVAQSLNGENPDVLFNTSQVLVSLAEQLSADGNGGDAVALLQEALELLSACLSRQEMLLEQQRIDFADVEDDDGGVKLDPDERTASTPGSEESGQMATIETPISPQDLLDTVQSSLSALTTLVSLADVSESQMLGNMAQSLTEEKAPAYIQQLAEPEQDLARFTVALARANFVAALADSQYNAYRLELSTYVDRLNTSFDIPGKQADTSALLSESQARTELVLSAIDQTTPDDNTANAAEVCWKQLSVCLDLLTKASKIETEAAKEHRAEVFEKKGNLELLRHRIAISAGNLAWQKSAPTLLLNAQTYFVGAYRHAQAQNEEGTELRLKWIISSNLLNALHGQKPKSAPPFVEQVKQADLQAAVEELVEEGYLDASVAQQVFG